jgi:hypothetical protein
LINFGDKLITGHIQHYCEHVLDLIPKGAPMPEM